MIRIERSEDGTVYYRVLRGGQHKGVAWRRKNGKWIAAAEGAYGVEVPSLLRAARFLIRQVRT